jgi:hypothetical protein
MAVDKGRLEALLGQKESGEAFGSLTALFSHI